MVLLHPDGSIVVVVDYAGPFLADAWKGALRMSVDVCAYGNRLKARMRSCFQEKRYHHERTLATRSFFPRQFTDTGRSVLGRETWTILGDEVVQVARSTLFYAALDKAQIDSKYARITTHSARKFFFCRV